MGKTATAAVAAAFVLVSCHSVPQQVAPVPATTTVTAAPPPEQRSDQPWQPTFPPKPANLLYTTFQDHAVLQRDKPIPVWGVAGPAAQVDVSFAGATAHATADASGNWRVELPAMKAGGPYTLAAKTSSGQAQSVTDVMVGDVYLCSGQSNMEMPLRLATNYDSEMWSAKNASIRLFHVQRFTSPVPRSSFGADASWSVTSPENVKEFSAVCYYFGRELQPVAGVPLGLIEDAWGGSAIQAWMSGDTLQALGGYDEALEVVKAYARDPMVGQDKWLAMSLGWWKAHDPALAASPPWTDPALDDSAWQQAVPKGILQQWGPAELKTVNGIVWLRKTFNATAAQAAGPATLNLGPVWESDTTWINGVNVGAFDSYDVKRVYQIPAGVLHEGNNLLAVGFIAGVGILAPTEQITVKFADGSSVALTGAWKYKLSAPRSQTGRTPYVPWLNQFGVSTLYNGMIAPLGDTQIRGIVWYQGETDAWQPKEYARLLPAMIAGWRAKFGADVPFFNTQLTAFGDIATKPQRSDWAALRDVQRRVANDVPNTGLAVTIDLGVHDNIHPAAKQEVGRRLALLAETRVYGVKVEDSGPAPVSAVRTGKTVTVSFQHVARGLAAYSWDRVIGFELCNGEECAFAPGKIVNDQVVLDATVLPKATAVRYCWADSPMCNLYNSEALPAGTFEVAISKLNRTPRHRDFRKVSKEQ